MLLQKASPVLFCGRVCSGNFPEREASEGAGPWQDFHSYRAPFVTEAHGWAVKSRRELPSVTKTNGRVTMVCAVESQAARPRYAPVQSAVPHSAESPLE